MFCEASKKWLRPAAWIAGWLLLRLLAMGSVTAPDATVGLALRALSLRAATIVTGRVAQITREGDVVIITLAVDETLKGTVASSITLREWAGLWPLGQSRVEPGQRATFFLHAPGKSGLASTVDGSDGVIPITQQSADQPALLDVRRLAARIKRSIGTPLPAEDESAILLSDAKELIRQANVPVVREPVFSEPIRRPLPIELRPSPPRIILQRPIEVEGLSR